jgi:hypothetical protein
VKDKATVCFRLMQAGRVVRVIINEAGKISVRNFWVMSEKKEYKWILKLIELDNPDNALPLIELTWN